MYDGQPIATNAFQAQDSQLTFALICLLVQCLMPCLDGHYFYAYFMPRPIHRPPHSTLLHVLSGVSASTSGIILGTKNWGQKINSLWDG